LIRSRVAADVREGDSHYETILIEVDDALAAVCVLDTALDDGACDVIVVAVANDFQGGRVETGLGALPLANVAIDVVLARAVELGADRARALVARSNTRSINMVTRAAFVRTAAFDRDYDVYSVTLA
jgi:hypothetical protein